MYAKDPSPLPLRTPLRPFLQVVSLVASLCLHLMVLSEEGAVEEAKEGGREGKRKHEVEEARLLSKFVEGGGEKVDRAVELFVKYQDKVREGGGRTAGGRECWRVKSGFCPRGKWQVSRLTDPNNPPSHPTVHPSFYDLLFVHFQVERARLRLAAQDEDGTGEQLDEREDDAEEKRETRLARLMDAGLYMLQRVAVVLGFVYSRSLEGQERLRKRMKMEGREGLGEVADVLREYALSVGEDVEGAVAEGGGAARQRRRLRFWAAHLEAADGGMVGEGEEGEDEDGEEGVEREVSGGGGSDEDGKRKKGEKHEDKEKEEEEAEVREEMAKEA